MSNLVGVLKSIWVEFESVIELFIYLGIAFGIQKLLGLNYLESIGIVFTYFMMNLLRVVAEAIRNKYR